MSVPPVRHCCSFCWISLPSPPYWGQPGAQNRNTQKFTQIKILWPATVLLGRCLRLLAVCSQLFLSLCSLQDCGAEHNQLSGVGITKRCRNVVLGGMMVLGLPVLQGSFPCKKCTGQVSKSYSSWQVAALRPFAISWQKFIPLFCSIAVRKINSPRLASKQRSVWDWNGKTLVVCFSETLLLCHPFLSCTFQTEGKATSVSSESANVHLA